MLNIIYSRPRTEGIKPQGKKTLVAFLHEEYDVKTIKKYTSQSEPDNNVDTNLIYLGNTFDDEKAFIDEIIKYNSEHGIECEEPLINERPFYVYSRIKDGETCYYGISSSDIKNALQQSEQFVLVCTNIECIHEIRRDAKNVKLLFKKIDQQTQLQLRAYCLVRQHDTEDTRAHYLEENKKKDEFFQQVWNLLTSGTSQCSDELKVLRGLCGQLRFSNDGRLYYLPKGEDLELDFFRNVSLFQNLLLIPECGNLEQSEGKNTYNRLVSPIVEKYMELRKKTRTIFVIHPMSDIKFTLIGDIESSDVTRAKNEQKQFRSFIELAFKKEVKDGQMKLVFAEDVSKRMNGTGDLVSEILKEISKASIVIADFRNVNHNCIYEAGYAYALQETNNSSVFFIAPIQHGELIEKLSFDVKTFKFHFYNLEKMIGSGKTAIKELNDLRESMKFDRGSLKFDQLEYSKDELDKVTDEDGGDD